MKLKPVKLAPALIAVGVILIVCALRISTTTEATAVSENNLLAGRLDFFERLERMTYDMRVREATQFPSSAATNLGFAYIDEQTIAKVHDGSLGYKYGLYWPRQVYGRVVEEFSAQGAKAVAFDVIFGERRWDHPLATMADGRYVQSDEFFALQMQRAGNVILAVTKDVSLPNLFATNAAALGDISTEKDPDGILRRVKAFQMYRQWHWAFKQVEENPDMDIDLRKARTPPGQIILVRGSGEEVRIPLDADGNFELADLGGVPAGVAPKAKPFTEQRVWHMGIVLAARELGIDLTKAEVDLAHGRIVLRGPNVERIIPVDAQGYFYIDWCLPGNDPRLLREPVHQILLADQQRITGATDLPGDWKNKLVVVGSSASGNDLTDRGATPLEEDTLLVSKHWNVANSILTDRFIRRSPLGVDLLLIALLGALAAVLTWQLRALVASATVVAAALLYIGFGVFLYVQSRYWLPLVFPVVGALLTTHVFLVTWRVIFEQAEQRRVKSIFSRIVSPNIVTELLEAETLALGGARREVSVMFADVRGFTEFTDHSQEKAAAYVLEHHLSGSEVDEFFDEQARETLSTVNTYLALVAEKVKSYDGTLDKYIGDCVMAFWGAPTPNPQHAIDCVRAAIEAQRAVYAVNRQRTEENQRRELENLARTSAGLTPKPLLPVLLLGTGVNTGMATVGLMGSEAHLFNYTVFGREVNFASRLETLSGRGRILISETTYNCLLRDDATLAGTCLLLPDLQKLKGFGTAVKVYEVPWRPPGWDPFDEEIMGKRATDTSSTTNFIRRENL